jgi:hypothetical protein
MLTRRRLTQENEADSKEQNKNEILNIQMDSILCLKFELKLKVNQWMQALTLNFSHADVSSSAMPDVASYAPSDISSSLSCCEDFQPLL